MSVYYPSFGAPGAEYVDTCLIGPGSADCSFPLDHTTGSVELVATADFGSTFSPTGSGWVDGCRVLSGNTCVVDFDGSAPRSYAVKVAFSLSTEPVRISVSVVHDTIDIDGTGPAGVLRTNYGHTLDFAGPVVNVWDFDLPPEGLDVTVSVEPETGMVVRYIYAFLTLLTDNAIVCGAVDFVASCTFSLRPNELAPVPILAFAIKLEPAPLPPPPPPPPINVLRYVAATGGRDGNNDCTDHDDPCLTIQHGLTQAVAGDRVQVASGTYTGLVHVSKAVTLDGGSHDTTILNGQFSISGNAGQNLTGDVSITEFTVASVGGAGVGVAVGTVDANADIAISHVEVSGFSRGVDAVLSGGSLSISEAVISNNTDDGIHIEGLGRITLASIDAIGNAADGIQFSNVGSASAGSATSISIADALIEDNNQAGIQVEGMESGSFSLVRSCIGGNGRHALPGGQIGQAQAGVTLSDLNGVSVAANGNNIAGNHAGGVSVASVSGLPNFRNNWWGNPAGPSGTNGATGTVDVTSPAGALVPGTPCS